MNRWVLFDAGGVLVRLDHARALSQWRAGSITREEWLMCRSVQAFERGELTEPEFASDTIRELGLQVSREEFVCSFRAWILGPFEGIREVTADCRARGVSVGCLSNTNPIHWATITSMEPWIRTFDRLFLSYQIGNVKPEAEIYAHVLHELSVQPEEILLLDDNQLCVDGARDAGWQAERVDGMCGAAAALERLGWTA